MPVIEIRVLPATPAHAAALAPRLRPADELECRALGMAPYEALRTSIARGLWAEAYLVDGEVAAIVGLGLSSFLGGHGVPWLLTSAIVECHRKTFLRCSRDTLARMMAEVPLLVNWVHAENVQAIRWLRWLGFDVAAEPVALPPHGAPFHRFQMERPTGELRVRPLRARDLYRIKPNAMFGKPPLDPVVLATLERLPSFTGEIEGRIVACAGVLPCATGYEAWAYFSSESRPVMVACFNACRRFLDGLAVPTRALIDTPARQWARLLGFRPTTEMSATTDGRSLPIYIREKRK
jgi:hypothetical protein